MKTAVILVAVLSVALGFPAVSQWSLHELSAALQDPNTDPAHIPILEAALNEMMSAIMAGQDMESIAVSLPVMPEITNPTPVVPSPPGTTTVVLTLHELAHAIEDPNTDPAHLPYLEAALNEMMMAIMSGNAMESIAVSLPITPEITNPTPVLPSPPGTTTVVLTLHELAQAIEDPNTDPAHLPYLEAALNEMMMAIMSGNPMESIAVSLPVNPEIVIPSPVLPPVLPEVNPILPTPVLPSPVQPVLPETPEAGQPAASAPLVQIIVNINQQNQVGGGIVTTPVEQVPESVNVVDQAPETVNVVDQAPESVVVVEVPEGNPADVIAITPPEGNPADVIAITPPESNPADVIAITPPETNPIDVIAVAPPVINPADILHPVPVHG